MSQQELLKRVVEVLKQNGIDYMLTGSLVSSLQGDPRATHDIDLVVLLSLADASLLQQAFPPPRFYLDDLSMRHAISRLEMFNLLDADTGDKVDFWPLTKDPFDQSRFGRKTTIELEGIELNVSRPEDTILQKLKWAKDSGGSERQVRDARGVYELQSSRLDEEYLNQWAKALGIEYLLEQIRSETKNEHSP